MLEVIHIMRKVVKIRWTKRRSNDAMKGLDIATLSVNDKEVALITAPLSREEIREALLALWRKTLTPKEQKAELTSLAEEPNVEIFLLESEDKA